MVRNEIDSFIHSFIHSFIGNIPSLEQDQILGSIPILTTSPFSPAHSVDYTDLLHLNVQYNPSSFAVVPINRDRHTLQDIRNYMTQTLFSPLASLPAFGFVSRNGGTIAKSQEDKILAWSESVEQQWAHHTFNTIITRHHLFITLSVEEITVWYMKRDDDDDDE